MQQLKLGEGCSWVNAWNIIYFCHLQQISGVTGRAFEFKRGRRMGFRERMVTARGNRTVTKDGCFRAICL